MTGLVLLRARAHRLLLAAALLTVLLTTAVLATLTAYSGAIGDASLRHALQDPRNAVDTALIVQANVSAGQREAADSAVRKGARQTFGGFPVTLRTLVRSGPYALPRTLQAPADRAGDPDLTHFAALDHTQVRVTAGRLPHRSGAAVIEVALPENAAGRLGLRPGARLTLVDRLGGPKVRVRITGLYRPARPTAPYWQLDELGGRGINKVDFTTYGPLLADPAVLTGGRVSAGESAWLASADFSTLTPGRIGALRDAARAGPRTLRKAAALSGTTGLATSLPDVLDRVERSLLVSRSTLLIVALQLALLAGYALLLVARLLSAERTGETRVLRARGASRGRVAGLAALEALLLAVPAALCAPLLAGPLTRLLAGQGALARIGLRLDTSAGRGGVWLVAAAVALGCALAVTVPALTSGDTAEGRARSLPAPVRAGADVGLLVIAGVAYWQLDRQTSGAVTGDRSGTLGIDPLLVSAPALALLAGTVLTLRLLPPVARLAERRAASGRGLPAALAGWQLSRRPMRGAGPVLLLVLAVAMGMLAIGQGASWDHSQDDQADFQAGTSVRVLGGDDGELGQAGFYATLPHVRAAAPAVRTALPLSGNRTATVLALDTAHAADGVLLRDDLAGRPVRPLLAGLAPKGATTGTALPKGATRLGMTARIHGGGDGTTADVTVTLEDRYGTPYAIRLGQLPADGRAHPLALDLSPATGPLILTGLQLDMTQPIDQAQHHLFSVEELTATGADGTEQRLPLPTAWKAASQTNSTSASPDASTRPKPPQVEKATDKTLAVRYGTGYVPHDFAWQITSLTVRLHVVQPVTEATAIATDRFLTSAGARIGQRMDVPIGGETVPVRIVASVRALPTTGSGPGTGGASAKTGGAVADGGALLVDLRSVNRVLESRYGQSVAPTEWWLRTAPGDAARVAAAVRERPDIEPSQVVVRDEIADGLRDDPFGAGPEAAFAAAAVVAAALAAVGFAVSTAGSLRERGAEFAVLRALGAPRRQLARLIAAEQGVLVALALVVGVALGAVLTRAVVPLIVLTSDATRPVPQVLVQLPLPQVAVLLAAVAVTPLAITAFLALHRPDPASSLRRQGGE
ncbi:ABC transporter permease [Streptomyces sp. NBC_01236]|uniref:ABC transporter permease n=1 Tax=Streptomyces sp. NBC_01236 TaxID=2903789 RepID=UPI002E0F7488|nr:ABC transporter permease [Streptomyces sp. NBC_01236]